VPRWQNVLINLQYNCWDNNCLYNNC